jgi:DNA-binding response OmpR family regulator
MPLLLADTIELLPLCANGSLADEKTPARTPEQSAEPAVTSRRPARILVVDDEPRIRLALRVALESEGYQISEAADGEEALEKIVASAPDLMLLDLAMPRMDGMRTIEALQALHGQLKPRIIVLTAWGSPPVIMKSIAMGVSIFLEKPLAPEALRDAVRRALAENPDPDAGIPIDWT